MAGLKRGDKVEWNTSQGPTRGNVVRQTRWRWSLMNRGHDPLEH